MENRDEGYIIIDPETDGEFSEYSEGTPIIWNATDTPRPEDPEEPEPRNPLYPNAYNYWDEGYLILKPDNIDGTFSAWTEGAPIIFFGTNPMNNQPIIWVCI